MIYVSFHASFSGGKNISLAWSSWVFLNLKDQCSEWTTRPREQIWRNLNKEKKLVKRPNWKIIAKDLYKSVLLWRATCLYERPEQSINLHFMNRLYFNHFNIFVKLIAETLLYYILNLNLTNWLNKLSVKLIVRVGIFFTRGLILKKYCQLPCSWNQGKAF